MVRPSRRRWLAGAAALASYPWVSADSAVAPALPEQDTAGVDALLGSVARWPPTEQRALAARIEKLSRAFLKRPYRLDPLGEGPNAAIDPDPLWRLDEFDCLSLVEIVLALARAQNHDDFEHELRSLRYQNGMVDFGARKHFMEADWLPSAVRQGALRDLTDSLPAPVVTARGVLTRRSWYQGLAANPLQAENAQRLATEAAQAELARLAAAVPVRETVSLRYTRLREADERTLQAVCAAIPQASVLLIVRPSTSMFGKVGAVTHVSHLGFVFASEHGAQYRHASSRRAHRAVIDAALLPYLQQLQTTKSFTGIKVLQPIPKSISRSP